MAVNPSSGRQEWLAPNALKNTRIDALLSLLSITSCVSGSSLPRQVKQVEGFPPHN